jgi:AcrR family transcriptional regulator
MPKHNEPERERSWTHRADNRERLIAAGYTVLSEKGFEATTVKEVARVAGVSPGLFHYYFASKDALLIAVLQEAGTRYGEMMRSLRAAVPADQFLAAAVAAARERVLQEREWYRLRYELFALSLRNPTFLPILGDLLTFIRQMFARAFQDLTDRDEAQAHALAALALACFDGLALQQLAQPDADLTRAYDLLLALILGDHPSPPQSSG